MRILLTGSSGRVGRALFAALAARGDDVVGLDRSPFATTRHLVDVGDAVAVRPLLQGVDAVVHVAGLHAPHVGRVADTAFEAVNVVATRQLALLAREAGVRRFVFTSTTALYGDAVVPGQCRWIDADTPPLPRTIYHRSKLRAEAALEEIAGAALAVRVLRMSRCFPERADAMAVHRLHRGIDVRDVADAHVAALHDEGAPFARYLVSAVPAFAREDVEALASDARDCIGRRVPALAAAFVQRDWALPLTLDRVYDPALACARLRWQPRHGFDEVLAQHDRRSLEVLPVAASVVDTAVE